MTRKQALDELRRLRGYLAPCDPPGQPSNGVQALGYAIKAVRARISESSLPERPRPTPYKGMTREEIELLRRSENLKLATLPGSRGLVDYVIDPVHPCRCCNGTGLTGERETCSICDGSGTDPVPPVPGPTPAPEFTFRGTKLYTPAPPEPPPPPANTTCTVCLGTGKDNIPGLTAECWLCQGTGKA